MSERSVERPVPEPGSRAAQGQERPTPLAAGLSPDLFVFLAFLLLPILGRVLRAAQERAEQKMRQAGADRPRAAPRAEPPSGGPDIGELEQSGADLWRRLLGGEEVTRAPRSAPAPVPVPAPPPRILPRRPAEPPPAPALQEALAAPAESELGRLAAIPEIAPPASDDIPTLEEELAASLADTRDDGLPSARALGLAPFSLGGVRDELARAILWSEILAPPLALREPDARAAWRSSP